MATTWNSTAAPSVFTSITCVVRSKDHTLLALDHVLYLLDALLDVTVRLPLPKAAASGDSRLFDRVFQKMATTQPPMDAIVQEYKISKAMEAAVEHRHMDIVQRIHRLYPERLPVRLLEKAAANGDLPMFQWLLAHRTDEFCTSQFDGDASIVSVALMRCCLQRAYAVAIQRAQLPIVKWLLESGFTMSASFAMPGDAAAAAGDLDFVQWLHSRGIRNSFSKGAIDNAAKGGHLEIVQYLLANRAEGFTSEAVHHAILGGYDEIHEVLRLSGVLSPEEFQDVGSMRSTQLLLDAWICFNPTDTPRH